MSVNNEILPLYCMPHIVHYCGDASCFFTKRRKKQGGVVIIDNENRKEDNIRDLDRDHGQVRDNGIVFCKILDIAQRTGKRGRTQNIVVFE